MIPARRSPAFTADWFTDISWAWEKYLPPFFSAAVAWLEVGSYEGRSALWTIDNILHPGSAVWCVDHFDAAYEKLFDQNTADEPRIVKIKGKARDVLPLLSVVFGGAYIDGAHEEEEVAHDARVVWRLLRPGSPLVFDDYGMASVGRAVDAFLHETGSAAEIIFTGWQMIVRKVA